LYLADQIDTLLPPPANEATTGRERAILDVLGSHGASFFGPLHDAAGGGYS
jgi:hypothetical protein